MKRVHFNRALMRHKTLTGIVSLVVGCASAVYAEGDRGGSCIPPSAEPDQVVMELTDSGSFDAVMAAITASFPGVSLRFGIPSVNAYLLNVPEPLCEQTVINALMQLPGVEEAEFNQKGESSEGQTQSFFFAAVQFDFDSQYAMPTIRLEEAQSVTLGSGTIVAIIDSGFDEFNTMLADAAILPPIDFVGDGQGTGDGGDGIDNDGDGAIDEMAGHGTFVAGLIHAIAPAATLMPLRAIDSDGHGESFAVAAALAAAIEAQVDVINISFGSPNASEVVKQLIADAVAANIVVVVSAGNGGVQQPTFPAGLFGVCAVAATDAGDTKTQWSNYGTFVDLCGPGKDIVSTMPGNTFAFGSGTSMAAPFVSGSATLVRALHPGYGSSQVIGRLKTTAHRVDAENPKYLGKLGAGRVDLAAAVGIPLVISDLNGDGAVNAVDLSILIGAWGTQAADINNSGTTDAADLSILIGAWTG